jgi:endo-1,4-beta-xylanase
MKRSWRRQSFWRHAISVVFALSLLATQARAATTQPAAQSLADKYRDQFTIGVALGGNVPGDYSDKERNLIVNQFNAVTPEDCMKLGYVQPAEGRFFFAEADAIVAFAQANHMKVAGHCLVWANDDYTPKWFFRDGDHLAARPLILQRLKTHIQTVVGRYRGKVQSWDVVNEALSDGKEYLRPSQWEQLIGPDFIAKAFEFAHEADPDALLIYNDYLIEKPSKRAKLMRLLTDLKNNGVPIQAVGNQGHWEVDNVPYHDLELMLDQVSEMGLKVVISELDLGVVPRTPWWADDGKHQAEIASHDLYATGCPPDLLKRQAEQYGWLFGQFLQHRQTIVRVTFWNLHDGRSWLNQFPWKHTEYPLLFDRHGNPKAAYDAVMAVP